MIAPTTRSRSRLLVVDDAVAIHDDFRKILCPAIAPSEALLASEAALFGSSSPASGPTSFVVDSAYQGEEGVSKVATAVAAQDPYALAFVDMRMPPGLDGIETIRRIWAVDRDVQIVICTAYSDYSWEQTVEQLGQSDSLLILKKPFDNIEVLQLAHALTTKWQISRRDRLRLAELDEMVRQRTAALQRSEERFSRAFQANPFPVVLQYHDNGCIFDANQAFLKLSEFGGEDLLDRTGPDLGLWVGDDLWPVIAREIGAGRPVRDVEARLRTRSGLVRDVRVTSGPITVGARACVLSTIEDVTEQLRLERQLRQSQKLEGVGQLAAGIAHDFNNLLTVILSYTGLALLDGAMSASARANLAQVRSSAERAAALTRQLLIFSRKQVTQPKAVDLSVVLLSLRDMLGRLIPERIKLTWSCPSGLPAVLADEANLEQAVINLVVNARDAMPKDGRIDVSLTVVILAPGETTRSRHPDARPGSFIRLSVEDSGTGIEPAVLARIFEPFFTTKEPGKGTGLGLSTVYAILRQHGGWVEVDTKLGRGTRFDCYLPSHGAAVPAGGAVANAPAARPDSVLRGERILFVEDDQAVRDVAKAIFSRENGEVVIAHDGPSACAEWEKHQGRFDLLVSDMVMPNGMSGMDLAARFRATHPQLKVLFATGYSPQLLAQNGGEVKAEHLLQKPFTRTTLFKAIRQALDSAPE